MALLVVLILSTLLFIVGSGAQSIGVCNGGVGNNLPNAIEVVGLYKANNIKKMRIYSPNQETLRALRGSDIELILDAPNVKELTDPSFASRWVQNNVIAYYPDVKIRYIAVGNEINPGAAAGDVFPAMQNVHNALVSAGRGGEIKVSTATYSALLGVSHPPSQGSFRRDALNNFINPIVRFLSENKSPLLVNIYPYFSYIGDPQNIKLSYALFTAPAGHVEVNDGPFKYTNLFDAMLDSTYAALEKVDGGSGLDIIVSESGWPSNGGGSVASMDNARIYNRNLIGHVKSGKGTPRRPGKGIQVYLFAMFDENQKPGAETEKYFGLFTPQKQSKYQLVF